MLGPISAFKIFAVSHLLLKTRFQCLWPEVSFQDFCCVSPRRWYYDSMRLARDRFSRFLQFPTSELLPRFSAVGPNSVFKIFVVSHVLVITNGPMFLVGFQDFCNLSPSS